MSGDPYKPEQSPAVAAFLAELAEVCKKHGMCIGHEDTQGGFEVWPGDEHVGWMMWAADRTGEEWRKAK